MEIRKLTDDFAVAPQIAPGDLPAVARAGYTTLICNRPDHEVPADLSSSAIAAAARDAGLAFHDIPVETGGLPTGAVAEARAAIAAAEGPVLAYCRSGTRSTILWALVRAGDTDPDTLIARAADAGYDISGLRPALTAPGG